MHNLIGPLLVSFNGDSEIFYPKFYKFFIDNSEFFKGLSHACIMLLVMEIANLMLGYITGATFIDALCLLLVMMIISLPKKKSPSLNT